MKLIRKSIVFAVLALSFAACGSKGGGGGLTKDSVKDFRAQLREEHPKYADALAKATDKFGPPAKKDDKKATWTGKDGDSCFEFFIEDMNGQTSHGTSSADCPK